MSNNSLKPPAELTELRALSRRLGVDLTIVQGSGGNISVKDGDVLWVKASGTWLIDAETQDILVPIDLLAVKKTLRSGGSEFNDAVLRGTLRPSIETSLHSQLSHRIVVHVHSVNAIAWSVQAGAIERLRDQLLGVDWRYIPYAKPGASLTTEVARVLGEEPGEPKLLVLENHGLVLGGDDCAAVETLLADVESRLQIAERKTAQPDIRQLEKSIADLAEWRLPTFPDIHRISLDTGAIKVATGGVLIPDHAVFLERRVPICESPGDVVKTISQYETTFGEQPDWMIVRGTGVILSKRIGAAGEDQLRGLAMIALRIPDGAVVRFIDEDAVDDLRVWDAEKYRKQLDEDLSKASDHQNGVGT